MILAKWGGSLLTHKHAPGPPRFRARPTAALAHAWSRALGTRPALVVHGAGSYGHPAALRHRIGASRLGPATIRRVVPPLHARIDDIQRRVAHALFDAGVAATALPARAALRRRGAHWVLDPAPFRAALDAGLHPVTGGDVVPDPRLGARILGGDEILHDLALALRPRRALWLVDVDGVLDPEGHVISDLTATQAQRAQRALPPGRDATGGIRAKLAWARRLQRRGIEAWILNGHHPDRVAAAARGQRPTGTRLAPIRRL